jgi:hypothetical protein
MNESRNLGCNIVERRICIMGFIDPIDYENLPVIYNVVHAVGKNCPNLRDDVKLVQYLLIAYYDVQPRHMRPPGEMAVTGFCGYVTMSYIHRFQADQNKVQQRMVARDGRIDRVRGGHRTGTILGQYYTYYSLIVLNRLVLRDNTDAFERLPTVVPLEDDLTVAPPSADMVGAKEPAFGGNLYEIP